MIQERHMTTRTSSLTTFSRTLAFAGAFTAMAVTATCLASPLNSDPPSVQVRYDDLNLTTASGARALYHRITVAARQVCPDPYTRDLGMLAASEHCQATAIAGAVRELNNPQLALVHAAHVSRVSHG
jgi:UrcA family protein